MEKDKVAEILVAIGTLLELKGENPFKTRAYANAARTIQGLHEPLDRSWPKSGSAKSRASARRWNKKSPNWWRRAN